MGDNGMLYAQRGQKLRVPVTALLFCLLLPMAELSAGPVHLAEEGASYARLDTPGVSVSCLANVFEMKTGRLNFFLTE